MTVTDIEFLSNSESQNAPSSVYVYHSGRLLSQVKLRIKRNADLEGRLYMSCEPRDLVAAASGGSLFQGMRVCNWSRSPAPKATLERLREAMLAGSEEQIFLFVRRGDFSDEDILKLQTDKWLIIQEKPIGQKQLEGALQFFCETSDIEGAGNLHMDAGFRHHFESLIDEEGQQSIGAFVNEFDRVVLLHSDRSGAFNGQEAHRIRNKRTQLAQSIRNLIFDPNEEMLTQLVSNVSAIRQKGTTDGDLIEQLCRTVADLVFRFQQAAMSSYSERRKVTLFLAHFVMSVSKLKEAARRNVDVNAVSDDLLILVDQIGRQFLRTATNEAADPFESSWSLREYQTRQMLVKDEAAPRRLFDEISTFVGLSGPHLRIPWISRFHRFCLRCLDGQDLRVVAAPDLTGAGEQERIPFLSEILDQDVIVRSLQWALKKTDHDTPILLYGSDGVRKREIARAYARALLCEERPDAGVDACGACQSCRSFQKRNSFGLVELEARLDTASNVRRTLKKLSYAPFTRHRVIIIESSGKSKESEEAFLEALEMGREATTFILLAERPELLDPATVSRCLPYRVKPPSAEDSGPS